MSEDRRYMRIRYDVMKHILVFNPRTKSVAFRGVPFLPVMFSVED
ncbi:hypothetical protein T4A_8487 [Trichinella pseudospiralis]|uniref:Uncharacterized protein n=1 Tax=Trichinella pseudospiralis TaxID=6337 RepID=A0A0V1IKL3_TRIPS|nr:hypothetical protein T4A_8082 [Trichinella pseudospiralis]KRY64659.1 hypothetical protein T4A_4891 [Trichinella pseudospiralis]KRY67768.1 hypothetical protein T4A_8487 [Trichinella pseudospiralis]KRZ23418.1 hypothetical protein T4C_14074 [Trichinella pseudospiralis]KRZ23477.1 hypothetical protein T4C_3346 [Trichinella pseudospiralis]